MSATGLLQGAKARNMSAAGPLQGAKAPSGGSAGRAATSVEAT
jgi:hypothetical protein